MTGEAFLCGTASVNAGSGAGVTSLVLTTGRSKPAGQRAFLFIAYDRQKGGSPSTPAGWTLEDSGSTTGAASADGGMGAWEKDEAVPAGTAITFTFNQSVKWAYAFMVYFSGIVLSPLDINDTHWVSYGVQATIAGGVGAFSQNFLFGVHDAKFTMVSCLLTLENTVDADNDPRFQGSWTELGYTGDDIYSYAGGEGGLVGLAGVNMFPHLTFGWREVTGDGLVSADVGPYPPGGGAYGDFICITVGHWNYTPPQLGSGCGAAVGLGDECSKTAGIGTGDECSLTAGIGSGDECAKTDGVTVYTGVCE